MSLFKVVLSASFITQLSFGNLILIQKAKPILLGVASNWQQDSNLQIYHGNFGEKTEKIYQRVGIAQSQSMARPGNLYLMFSESDCLKKDAKAARATLEYQKKNPMDGRLELIPVASVTYPTTTTRCGLWVTLPQQRRLPTDEWLALDELGVPDIHSLTYVETINRYDFRDTFSGLHPGIYSFKLYYQGDQVVNPPVEMKVAVNEYAYTLFDVNDHAGSCENFYNNMVKFSFNECIIPSYPNYYGENCPIDQDPAYPNFQKEMSQCMANDLYNTFEKLHQYCHIYENGTPVSYKRPEYKSRILNYFKSKTDALIQYQCRGNTR